MKRTGLLIILIIIMGILPVSYGKTENYKTFNKVNGYSAKADKNTGYVTIDKSGREVKFKLINPHSPIYVDETGKAKHKYASDILTETYLVDAGLEYMIILNTKPTTNLFTIEIQDQGYQWYYQPPLYDEYEAANETHAIDANGSIIAERPLNVVNSYAVYDGQNKLFHIYRPLITDSKGDETWGILNYKDGVLTVKVPQSFLDKATYPVYVDPTFGYTTSGGSTHNLNLNEIWFGNYSYSGGAGNVALSIHARLVGQTGSTAGAALYTGANAYIEKTETKVHNTNAWYYFLLDSFPSLSNGNYTIAIWCNDDGPPDEPDIRYDSTVGANFAYRDDTAAWAAWPDPLTKSLTRPNEILSLYVSYAPNLNITIIDADTSDDPVERNDWAWLNVTARHPVDVAEITRIDVTVLTVGDAENFTLRWVQATDTFSEVSDPDNICTLDVATSESTNLNPTDILNNENYKDVMLSFNITITDGTSGLCDLSVYGLGDSGENQTTTLNEVFTFTYFNWVDEVYDYINSAFSNFGIIDYMAQITTYIEGLSTNFTTSLTRILELVVQQFTIIEEVYGFFIYWTTELFAVVIDFSTFYHELLDGTSAWSEGLVPWWLFIEGLMPIVPLAAFILWLDSIDSRGAQTVGGGVQVFINDVNTAIGLISYFFGVFSYVANTIIDRVYGLFQAIT